MYLFITMKKKNLLVTDEAVTSYFKDKGIYLITYEAPKRNPHYHIILKQEKYTADAIRMSITRKFDLPRGYKSVKMVENLEKSICYILKEQNVIENTLLSTEELDAYRILSSNISLEYNSKVSFKKKFMDNFPIEQFNQEEDDDLKRQIIVQYIQDIFEKNVEHIDQRVFDKYYTLTLMLHWKPMYIKMINLFQCKFEKYNLDI